MARIYICVHPDGTFTTGPYHGDPVSHAANQDPDVVTYMTEDVGILEGFGDCYKRHMFGGGYFIRGSYVVGDWKQWGAFCINKWGAWFERVDGHKRRARFPLPDKKHRVDSRILGMLERSSPMLMSVIRNRMRGTPDIQIYDSLSRLQELGNITEERFTHPINKTDSARYHLAAVKLADRTSTRSGCISARL